MLGIRNRIRQNNRNLNRIKARRFGVEFINVYMDKKGLWSASLCKNMQEVDNIGGSYPKSRSAELDAILKWGRKLDIKMSYTPMFYTDEIRQHIVALLDEGFDSEEIAKRLKLKPASVRAIKAHVTRGTYSFRKEVL